jgi:hypothetical protein
MINVKLTSDPKVLVGIYDYLRNVHGMIADSEEEAQAMMMAYLDAFIEEHGLDVALTDGLLIPECVA